MKNIKWLRYVIENTQDSPYCAQESTIKQWYELEPIDLKEIEKMVDERRMPTFEELMRGVENGQQTPKKEEN